MAEIPADFTRADFYKGFLDHSGPYYLGPDGGATRIGLLIGADHINYVGVAHGGVMTSFADVAMSYQLHVAERPRLAIVTNSLTTNFLAGAKLGDWLEAHARIDRIGKRTAYTSGEIRRGADVIMTMTGVFAVLRKYPESPV